MISVLDSPAKFGPELYKSALISLYKSPANFAARLFQKHYLSFHAQNPVTKITRQIATAYSYIKTNAWHLREGLAC